MTAALSLYNSKRRASQGQVGGTGLSQTEGSMECVTDQQAGSHSAAPVIPAYVHCLCALLPCG